MNRKVLTGVSAVVVALVLCLAPVQAGGLDEQRLKVFVDDMVQRHGWQADELRAVLDQASFQASVVAAIERPAESKTWAEYQDIFLTGQRVDKGVQFWVEQAAVLERAACRYGVPAEIIVSILGVETYYGERTGSYRVIDTLVTQAFGFDQASWRSRFGVEQLEHLFLLAREQGFDPLELQGSYAGAMGYGQFIPSSYRHFAVDFDGDGAADIWSNAADAIGSVANYLSENGWRRGGAVTVPASAQPGADAAPVNRKLRADSTVSALADKGYVAAPLDDQSAGVVRLEGKQGDEYWLGLHNYFTITTYNRSRLYAMAVYQLSERLRAAYHAES